MRRMPLPVSLLALALVLAASGACGSDDPSRAQPAPDVTVFAEGEFGSIPLLPRSESAGSRTEDGGVVAQSFRVRNASPERVFDFYRERLEPAWAVVEEPHALGESEDPSYRGIWHRDQHRLVVTVAGAGTLGDGTPGDSDDPSIQYSLSLEPAGSDTFENDSSEG